MFVQIKEINTMLIKILMNKGLSKRDAELVADDYINAEMLNKKTHGIVKFLKEIKYVNERVGKPFIIRSSRTMSLVNGNRELGQLAAKFCTELVIKKAKKYGIGIVGLYNIQRYGILSNWVEAIAKENLVGVVLNTCEPAVPPYNGISPILGTNPIAVGIPTTKEPLLIDMATSKSAMSELLLYSYNNKKLKANTFLDEKGNYVRDAKKVKAVSLFNGYKSFGLSLIIEIMSGSLITAEMGLGIKSKYDIGYYFQAINPSFFQDINIFKKKNTEFLSSIKTSKTKNNKVINLPGELSKNYKNQILNKGKLRISKKTYSELITEEQKLSI